MGTRPKVGNSNYIDNATITSSSEATSLPDDNVNDPLRTKVWRATGDTSEWIKFDLGSAQAVDLCCIFNHNFSASATVVLEGNSSDSWGTPAYQETFEYHSGVLILSGGVAAHNLPATYQFWRITIADPTNSDGYVEAGIIYIGSVFEFQRDWQQDFQIQPYDPSQIARSYDRQKSVDIRTEYDVLGWTIDGITEYVETRTLLRTVGIHTDVPLVLDDNDKTLADGLHELTYWGSFQSFGAVNPYKQLFNFDLAFEEAT